AVERGVGEQVEHGDVECVGDANGVAEREVHRGAFDVADVGAMQSRVGRERFLRVACGRSPLAQVVRKSAEEFVVAVPHPMMLAARISNIYSTIIYSTVVTLPIPPP